MRCGKGTSRCLVGTPAVPFDKRVTIFEDSKDCKVEAACRMSTINRRTVFRSFLALHRPPSCPQETDEYDYRKYDRYDHHGYKLTIVVIVIATRFTISRWLPRGAIRSALNAVEIRWPDAGMRITTCPSCNINAEESDPTSL